MLYFSPHLSRHEYLITSHRAYLGQQFCPPDWILENATRFALEVFEPARTLCGPLIVTSGYRCPDLNRAVGGRHNSLHTYGLAADLYPVAVSIPTAMGLIARSQVPFQELIFELGRWIHLAAPFPGMPPERKRLMYFGEKYEAWNPGDRRVA